MPRWTTDIKTGAVDYRLNLLGIRVVDDTCQLISRTGEEWLPLGPQWRLPICLPLFGREQMHANALTVTATQFCEAYPAAGLAEKLSGAQKPQGKSKRASKSAWRTPSLRAWTPPLRNCDHIASSRELIRQSRRLLDHRTDETV